MTHIKSLVIRAVNSKEVAFLFTLQSSKVINPKTKRRTTSGFYTLAEYVFSQNSYSGWITGSGKDYTHSKIKIGEYLVQLAVVNFWFGRSPGLLTEAFSLSEFRKTTLKRRTRVEGVALRIDARDKFCFALGLAPGVPNSWHEPDICYISWACRSESPYSDGYPWSLKI